MGRRDVDVAIELAAREGWNPGLRRSAFRENRHLVRAKGTAQVEER